MRGRITKTLLTVMTVSMMLVGCSAKVTTNTYTHEAGETLKSDVNLYASFKNPELAKEATIDLSAVDEKTVGSYEAIITLKDKTYPVTVEVVDTKAPDGSFETSTVAVGIDGKITTELFGITCSDVSEMKYGIKNAELVKTEEELKIQIDESFTKAEEEGKVEITLKDMAGITWNKDTDSWEESGFDLESLEEEFVPTISGLYKLELVCSDIYKNASIMNAYAIVDLEAPVLKLEDKEVTVSSDFETYMNSLNEGLYAEDNLLGDITGALNVIGSEVLDSSNTATKMKVTYEVYDLAGNRSEGSRIFTSKSRVQVVNKPTAEQPVQTQPNGHDRDRALQAFAAVNEQRAAAGVAELAWDEGMYETSCRRAAEIVNDFSHNGCPSNYGENIAENFKSITNLINAWMNSPGHKQNILDARYSAGAMGCYYYNGSYYWVNNFRF